MSVRSTGASAPRRLVAAAVALTVVAGAGTAVALWSAAGSGAGGVSARSAATVTLTATVGSADLYPGFTGGDLHFAIDNPNPYAVRFTAMVAGSVRSSNEPSCSAAVVSVRDADGLDVVVPAQTTEVAAVITDVATMDRAAPDDCQGATFTVDLTLSGAQA